MTNEDNMSEVIWRTIAFHASQKKRWDEMDPPQRSFAASEGMHPYWLKMGIVARWNLESSIPDIVEIVVCADKEDHRRLAWHMRAIDLVQANEGEISYQHRKLLRAEHPNEIPDATDSGDEDEESMKGVIAGCIRLGRWSRQHLLMAF